MHIRIDLTETADKLGTIATAVVGGNIYTAAEKRKSVIPVICRKLAQNGLDPDATFVAYRGPTPILARPSYIKNWVCHDWVDTELRGPHRVKYMPMPEDAKLTMAA
jgi:hypothetical protein